MTNEKIPYFKVADISIGHITEETSEWIANAIDTYFREISGGKWMDYGYILWVQEELDTLEETPDDLIQVYRWATEEGFEYVRLDCDSAYVDGLPRYEW